MFFKEKGDWNSLTLIHGKWQWMNEFISLNRKPISPEGALQKGPVLKINTYIMNNKKDMIRFRLH